MKNVSTKNNAAEINNATRKDNKSMKNNNITLTENDLRICSAILKALNDYHAQRTHDEDFSSAYNASDVRNQKAIMARYEYIEEQDEDFDFFAYLDERNISNPRLRKILEHELEAYWDEVAYANESAKA